MEQYKACAFLADRRTEITDELYEAVEKEARKALDFGCNTFYIGASTIFDRMCYKIITKIKKEIPTRKINRAYFIANEEYLKNIRNFRRKDYDYFAYLLLPVEDKDKIACSTRDAIIYDSDYLVFYVNPYKGSDIYKAYKCAAKIKDKHVVNLWLCDKKTNLKNRKKISKIS